MEALNIEQLNKIKNAHVLVFSFKNMSETFEVDMIMEHIGRELSITIQYSEPDSEEFPGEYVVAHYSAIRWGDARPLLEEYLALSSGTVIVVLHFGRPLFDVDTIFGLMSDLDDDDDQDDDDEEEGTGPAGVID